MTLEDTKADHKTSAIDRLSLIVDRPGNRLNQSTVIILEKPENEEHYPKDHLCDLIRERVLPKQVRFRCRISEDMNTFQEMDKTWRVEDHVHILRIEKADDEKDDEPALMRCISELQNLQMPLDKPLWDVHVIENYSRGTAMMWRIHHTIGDGFSLVTLFACLSDYSKDELLKSFRHNYFGTTEAKKDNRGTSSIVESCMQALTLLLFYFWLACASLYMAVKYIKFLFFTRESKTVFKTGHLSERKSLCWLHPDDVIDLDECSKVGKRYKSTINDVVVSCLLGGMARYMDKYQFHNKTRNTEIEIGISILANMRDPRVLLTDSKEAFDMLYTPGNKVGFMASRIQLYGIRDPVERLKQVSAKLTTLKNSGEKFLSYYSSMLVWMLPAWAIRMIWDTLLGGVTLVVSNVRGLANMSIGGRKLINSLGFVPGTGPGELAALVLSSHGKLNLCLNCNSTAVQDTSYLMECFLEEYKALKNK